MVIKRGSIWWADLGAPVGSGPGYRRPVLVVQANNFNRSKISTVVVVAITSNLNMAEAPGNIYLRKRDSGLSKDSVINVSQILSIDKGILSELVGNVDSRCIKKVESGLKLVLSLK